MLVIFPGTILFLAGGPVVGTINVLIQELFWTGFLCTRFTHPNLTFSAQFETDAPIMLFPK